MRMLLHPAPGRFDDHAQILKLRFPTKLALNLFRTGDQHCRIACASWANARRNLFSRNFARRFQNLIHAVAIAAATQIVNATALVLLASQRENVCAREIDHVNVVAHTRAVRRRIVVSIDFDELALAGSDLQRDRNQVGFLLVIFAAAFARAGGVEVTQGSEAEVRKPPHTSASRVRKRASFRRKDWWDWLERFLRWAASQVRHRSRRSRKRQCRLTLALAHRVEQDESIDDIISIILCRVFTRFADQRIGRHVNHSFDTVFERVWRKRVSVGQIGLNKLQRQQRRPRDGLCKDCRKRRPRGRLSPVLR